MILTVVVRLTRLVETAKKALVVPAGTVTVAGTEATDELRESVITAPPGGAGPASVTVPVELCPPTTLNGSRARRHPARMCDFQRPPADVGQLLG